MRGPPDPDMRNPAEAATTARAISQTNFNTADNATEPSKHQVRRILWLYALTIETASTVAELAFASLPR